MKSTTLFIYLLFTSGSLFAQADTSHFSYFEKEEYNAFIAESTTLANGTTQEKIVIDGFDSRVPFYYITPNNKEENKFILLLHGLTGSKDGWVYPMTSLSEKYIMLKDSLLAHGYTVIIPDAKYHGERSYEADFISPVIMAQNQDIQRSYNLYTTTVKDIRIIMDYIEGKSTTGSQSFDVIGYSMGGQMTILLNAVDNRLNRVVVCVAPLDMEKGAIRLGVEEENAGKLNPIAPKHFAPFQKAPITYLVATKDGWYTQAEAQDFFDEITIEDKTLNFYNSEHYLPEIFITDAINGIIKE